MDPAKGNLLSVRTYDVLITYDKYYQTPRLWLIGYDEASTIYLCSYSSSNNRDVQNRTPLTPNQIFEDVSADHALKTVTIEPFPHSSTLQAASVHPCKHASVMKKVIERMNAGIQEEQLRKGGAALSKDKNGKKWLFRKPSGPNASAKEQEQEEDEGGMRVDFYLVVFLKFIASIVPTIEVDATTSF